jgi:hypothetical protein
VEIGVKFVGGSDGSKRFVVLAENEINDGFFRGKLNYSIET